MSDTILNLKLRSTGGGIDEEMLHTVMLKVACVSGASLLYVHD